ncbi:MAG TPA: MerR family transcriptional regulator [Lachnospiraceae bacterium]|nr:MerR family transcriptional regulator [Lachnospiraceae bacterium]
MTITEASEKYELTKDTLRYYERIGLVPPVPRTRSGIRNYDEESCRWIEFIKCMRGAGMQIEALIEYVNLAQQGDDTLFERKKLLLEQREILLKKQEEIGITISRLNYKIENYDKLLTKSNASQEESRHGRNSAVSGCHA